MIGNLSGVRSPQGARVIRPLDPLSLFRTNEGFTSLAVVVALLVCLVLIVASASVAWNKSVSGDVQSVADVSALAGANTVSKYMTSAQVLDASVLSMGLLGMTVMATGLVVSAIPPISHLSPPILELGTNTLQARSKFARSAYEGLAKIEKGLPYLVAANSILVIEANGDHKKMDYTGVGVPFPYDGSDGSFASYDDLLSEAQDMRDSAEKVKEYSDAADKEKAAADEALERAWRADCGNEGYSMYERAAKLAGLPSWQNPFYPVYETWQFDVALERARAYYQQRLAQETPDGVGVEAEVASVSRQVFYEIALEKLAEAHIDRDTDGHVSINLPDLPRNTSDFRETHAYTDARWPLTKEGDSVLLHHSLSCPNAKGDYVGSGSLSELESGAYNICPICRFTIHDIGRAPLASSSISNGFEYHWREVVAAAKEYEEHANKQADLERKAKETSEKGASAFEAALAKLAAPRPKLTPPGRYGVVSIVGDSKEYSAPGSLSGGFLPGAKVPARAAISAASLAIDEEHPEENILSQFFENLRSSGGGIVSSGAGILDGLFDAWGKLLVAYGNAADKISDQAQSISAKADNYGLTVVSSWIQKRMKTLLDLAGFRPADLRQRKPVLTNTADVFRAAGIDGAVKVRSFINAVPSKEAMSDPQSYSKVLGQFSEDVFGTDEFEICSIPIPGTDLEIPISIKLSEL